MTISCDDTKDTVTSTFRVYILRNSAPVFTNLQASVSVSTTATVGTNVYTVTSFDAENDQLFYNMSCIPDHCPFTIFQSGDVRVSSDLHDVNVTGYDLYIYVYDGITLVGPKTLTVIFPSLNSAPVIINLPLMSDVIVAENAPLGSSVFQVSYTDRNIGDSHVITASFTPTSGSSLYSMNTSSGLISTSPTVNINYETLSVTSYLIHVMVYDGIAYTTSSLTVTIADVNEAPSFSKNLYYANGDEGSAGTSFGTPSFDVNDPDALSTHTYSIGCPEFDIEKNTGELILAVDYDLDKSTNPSNVTCVVTVSDGDLIGTATVAITINDVNDNAPFFGLPSYTFYVSRTSAHGTQLGSISATDRDAGEYGGITYALDQAVLGSEYFSVDSTGGVYVKQSLDSFSAGQALSLTATVTDTGGLTDSVAITIVIIETTTVAIPTTTDRHIRFLEDPRNVAWLSASCAVFGGLGLFIIYLVARYGSIAQLKKWCRRSRPSKTVPRDSQTFRDVERNNRTKPEWRGNDRKYRSLHEQPWTTSIQMN
ncbi:protocadherin-16-like isoform X1 [Crassostrea angulata]|uniref:protocadherin-16-like isoform X1 n=1 Tax=Magallana angulata TaxID=2784310 RepID=UPI0022B13A0B|nr:protocadherin-16-like isoform X1 [Crassostrea angulata]